MGYSMSTYCDHNVYKPKGFGYVLKCTHKKYTLWLHKTYPSLQGVSRMLLSRFVDEADIYYIYKYPDNELVAIGLPNSNKDNWRSISFTLKMLSNFSDTERNEYISRAKSFSEVVYDDKAQ